MTRHLRPADLWVGLRDGFRTQLWPLPTTAVLMAIAVGVALPRAEDAHNGLVPRGLQDYLFSGGADAARSVLGAVASSLINVTALTFSLTVVTLQLASSQFSPRLLRTFTRDLVVQCTLALFLATFTYALTVLRTVRASDSSRAEFVPNLSVSVAYLLAVASVVGLILFLAHLVQTIRVESMLRSVHDDASATLERELRPRDETPPTLVSLIPESAPVLVTAGSSGFLVRILEDDLLRAALEADAVVVIDVCPGDSLVVGTPIGGLWSARADAAHRPAELARTIGAALITGFERTSLQDVSFGLRQLTDVAVKALSPGVNDPTTAIHALGHSSVLLGAFSGRDLGPRVLRDEHGTPRVILARTDLSALLHLAVDQIARYGAQEPAVLTRLFQVLRELAWVCMPHQRPIVRAQLVRLQRLVERQDLDVEDHARLVECAEHVEAALSGTWKVGTRP